MVVDYLEETKKAMEMLSKEEDVVFIGQTVRYEGSPMYRSLIDIPMEKRIEMPVAEDMQMGISIGMAINGTIPVCIFPRMDFMLCATNQIVNHLDKLEEMSHGEFRAGIIIRTQIGNTKPLNPGPQHCGDYYAGFKKLCKNIRVIKLHNTEDITHIYLMALEDARLGVSTMIIEMPQGGKDPNKK